MSATTTNDVAAATRDLILVLADSKRLLGTRYAEWILGAPELEAGIACASMAQDEWGHGRLLYALLKDFGDDPDRLEHGREAAEYCSMELLDRAPVDWPALVVLNALADTALTVQLEALRESSHTALKQRVGKLLDEETFHARHGVAWFKRLVSGTPMAQAAVKQSTSAALPAILRWFGPDAGRSMVLVGAAVANASANALRERYLARVAPLLALVDVSPDVQPDFRQFDEATHRTMGVAPDAETIMRVRGDKNREFLVD
jgi:ring-1,2-phenylacetyl-CoA epoxidase subunit PaaC